MYTKSKYCRLCLSNNIKNGFKLAKIPLGEQYFKTKSKASKSFKYPVTISWCKDCKNVQLKEIIHSKDLWKNYTYISGQTKEIDDHFKTFANDTLKKISLTKKELILDIGSNDGSLLKHFKKYSRILGIDPAKNIVKTANSNGIKSITGLFNMKQSKLIKKKYGSAKIITAFNVFAHSENIREILSGIKDLLKEDGIFIFEVQYLKDIYDNKIIGTFFHEHMYHHSVTSLNNFFNSYDMKFYHVEKVNIQKGSIIGYVSKNKNIKVNNSIKQFLNYEKKNNIISLSKLKILKDYISVQKKKCVSIVKKCAIKGDVAGYGAARSGPLLASNYGVDKFIQFLLDDHPLKKNKYSSFNQLKVIPTKNINILFPQLCIILAYLHAKKIIKKNIPYIKRGGKFLLIHPKVKLVSFNNYKEFL